VKLTFAQVSGFVSKWKALKLTDNDLQALEKQIMEQPEGGDVMRGTAGVRKIRFAPPSWHTGKSGGTRVCYIVFVEAAFCYLFALFGKNEKPNLTNEEKRELQAIIPKLRKLHRIEK
jgi:hypothetical protein